MMRHSFTRGHRDDLTIKFDAFIPVTEPVNAKLGKTNVPYRSQFYLNAGVQIINDQMIEGENFVLITKFILRNYACNDQMPRLPPPSRND